MQLLVSVRSADEAQIIGRYPIDRLDLKEPLHGSLGATSVDTWQDVVPTWHERFGVSIALGELLDGPDASYVPQQTDSIKVGLSGCRGLSDWPDQLRLLYESAPESVSRVAVYYADQQYAGCPLFEEVLEVAQHLACETILVDTFGKLTGTVLNLLSESELISMRNAVHAINCQFALAGSIQIDDLPAVKTIHPDIVAVRSAMCLADRSSQICEQQVAKFLNSFHESHVVTAQQ